MDATRKTADNRQPTTSNKRTATDNRWHGPASGGRVREIKSGEQNITDELSSSVSPAGVRIAVNGERITVNSLIKALALGDREHIALVGGGGKTTLMFALADELRRSAKRVVTSTTTKVRHSEALEYEKVLFAESDADWETINAKALCSEGIVFVGRRVLDSGKVEGISASLADQIFRDSTIHYLIVEADGSAGHPLKAPAEHEPVIPNSTTMVVAMMGLEALGARLDETTAFRVEQVRSITGIEPGGIMTPSALAEVFLHPAGLFKGTFERARKVVFLNKGDLMEEDTKAQELADMLLVEPRSRIESVILGSLKKRMYRIRRMKDVR